MYQNKKELLDFYFSKAKDLRIEGIGTYPRFLLSFSSFKYYSKADFFPNFGPKIIAWDITKCILGFIAPASIDNDTAQKLYSQQYKEVCNFLGIPFSELDIRVNHSLDHVLYKDFLTRNYEINLESFTWTVTQLFIDDK
jgi:hypothetical protein